MRKYDVYHSDKSGSSLFATSRTRPDSAIKIAERINLQPGERVVVLKDVGPAPGDYRQIYHREG